MTGSKPQVAQNPLWEKLEKQKAALQTQAAENAMKCVKYLALCYMKLGKSSQENSQLLLRCVKDITCAIQGCEITARMKTALQPLTQGEKAESIFFKGSFENLRKMQAEALYSLVFQGMFSKTRKVLKGIGVTRLPQEHEALQACGITREKERYYDLGSQDDGSHEGEDDLGSQYDDDADLQVLEQAFAL